MAAPPHRSERDEILLDASKRAAARFVRWGVSFDELVQLACLAICQAAHGFRDDHPSGAPWSAWAYMVALRELPRAIYRLTRSVDHVTRSAHPKHIDPSACPDHGDLPLIQDELRKAMRDAIVSVMIDRSGSHKYAIPVLLDGVPAAKVATDNQVPVARVYRATRNARSRIRSDDRVRALWQLWTT